MEPTPVRFGPSQRGAPLDARAPALRSAVNQECDYSAAYVTLLTEGKDIGSVHHSVHREVWL